MGSPPELHRAAPDCNRICIVSQKYLVNTYVVLLRGSAYNNKGVNKLTPPERVDYYLHYC